MDFKTLQYFVSATQTLNFTQSSKELGVSQTTISLAISKLEKNLRTPLFDRNRRPMQLTDAGAKFYDWSIKILDGYSYSVERGIQTEKTFASTIRISVVGTYDALWIDSLIEQYHSDNPDCQIELLVKPPEQTVALLSEGEIDASIGLPYDLVRDTDLIVNEFSTQNTVIAMKEDHPLAARKEVTVSQLSRESVVMLTHELIPGSSKRFDQLCDTLGLSFKDIRQTHNSDEVILYLMLNPCLALVPEYYIPFLPDGIVTRRIARADQIQSSISYSFLRINQNQEVRKLLSFLKKNGNR